jgi:hypothetical protein
MYCSTDLRNFLIYCFQIPWFVWFSDETESDLLSLCLLIYWSTVPLIYELMVPWSPDNSLSVLYRYLVFYGSPLLFIYCPGGLIPNWSAVLLIFCPTRLFLINCCWNIHLHFVLRKFPINANYCTVCYSKVRATDCIFAIFVPTSYPVIGSIGLRIYRGRSTKSVAGVHTGATPARRCSWVIPCYTMLHLFCLVLWDRLGVERRTRHVFKNHVRRSTGIFGTNTNRPALNVLHSTSKFKHVCALFACRFLRPWVSLALKVFTGNVAKWQWRFGASWLQDHYYICVRRTWIYSILGSSNELFIIIHIISRNLMWLT